MKKLSLFVLLATLGLPLGCRKMRPNQPPNRPAAPDGPGVTCVPVDDTCFFFCGASDPDGDSLRYRVDWGDGDTSGWSEPEPNGKGLWVQHSWHSAGTFLVRAQALDEDDVRSDWSEASTTKLVFSWRQTYGGTSDDEAASVRQTYDGGYIVAGTANSFGAGLADVWLLRVDERGAKIWDKTLGGSADDRGSSVQQTYFGDFIVAGRTCSKGAGAYDAWLIRADLDGNVIWDRTFGGPGNDYAVSVRQTFDGGFAIAGVTCSNGAGDENVWLIRTDASGNLVWSRTYGGGGSDVASSVWQTSDRGFVITGTTGSYGNGGKDVWLIKTDSFGNVLWSKTFGGIEDDYAGSGQQTTDGGYVVAGTRGVNGGDVRLIKTDAEGGVLWDKTVSADDRDHAAWVEQTKERGYAIAGYTRGDYGTDVWLGVADEFGQDQFVNFCGALNHDDSGVCITETSDGGYIAVGNTNSYGAGMSDLWLIKLDGMLGPISTKSRTDHELDPTDVRLSE